MRAKFYLLWQINEIMVLNCRVCLEWPCVAMPRMVFFRQSTCVALCGLAWPLYGLIWSLWQNIVFSRGHRSKFFSSCPYQLGSYDASTVLKGSNLKACFCTKFGFFIRNLRNRIFRKFYERNETREERLKLFGFRFLKLTN